MSAYIITYYSESTSDTCIRRRTLPAEVVREGRRGRSGHMHSRNGDVHSPSDRSQSRIYLQTQVPAHWEAAVRGRLKRRTFLCLVQDGVGKLQGKVESHGCFTWFNIPQQSDMQATELTGMSYRLQSRLHPGDASYLFRLARFSGLQVVKQFTCRQFQILMMWCDVSRCRHDARDLCASPAREHCG